VLTYKVLRLLCRLANLPTESSEQEAKQEVYTQMHSFVQSKVDLFPSIALLLCLAAWHVRSELESIYMPK
jgi:hypothetical protein